MPRYIAFLRAINVGGRNVTMTILRAHFEELALENVESFIASGNIIFETKTGSRSSDSALEKKIEKKLHEALGYEVATFVRTPAEVAAIASFAAFGEKETAAAGALNVAFLPSPLDAATSQALLAKFRNGTDDFHVHGHEVYWLCKTKQSESKFSNSVFERVLKLKATFRSMTTIRKLAARYES